MRNKLSSDLLREALSELIGSEEVIVVYSALWTFGHLTPWTRDNLAEQVLNLIIDTCGPRKTVVFPSYSFSFCHSGQFDLVRTPSEVGALSQASLSNEKFVRTPRPIYSYAALGPRSSTVAKLPALTSWGDDSPMAFFEDSDTRVVVLGCHWERSASIIHRAEEKRRVAYRFFKTFTGTISSSGTDLKPISETMFVRSKLVPPKLDYSPATHHLRDMSSFTSLREAGIPFESVRADQLVQAAETALDASEFAFVTNRTEVEAWVDTGKALEENPDDQQ